MLRFFTGQGAKTFEVTKPIIERKLLFARTWLRKELAEHER